MKNNMNSTESTTAFDRARSGLWTSLQAHLTTVQSVEKAFLDSVAFTDSFPFAAGLVPFQLLEEYWKRRHALRDLYTDETNQLSTLVKAVRTKGYTEDEKKQLHLLILGYIDIIASTVGLLDTHVPAALPKDEELLETATQFDRLRKLVRLNVKGIDGLTNKFQNS